MIETNKTIGGIRHRQELEDPHEKLTRLEWVPKSTVDPLADPSVYIHPKHPDHEVSVMTEKSFGESSSYAHLSRIEKTRPYVTPKEYVRSPGTIKAPGTPPSKWYS